MQWMTVATPPFTDIDTFDRLTAQFDGAPAGMQARYVGAAEDGKLRVISLWESKEHADRFFAETLGPALARVLGPEPGGVPAATGIEVLRSYSPEPVA